MKKFLLSSILLALITISANSQTLTQTVRGTIIDTDSKLPIVGAGVTIPGTNPIIGAITDIDGTFRLENIPIGRINLQLSYMGYEGQTIQDIVVNSGKEVVLDLTMQESVIKMDEVVVNGHKSKGVAINDMSLISARSISTEETQRYTGAFNDPSRVVANYAGISSSPGGNSDIIVRGNSPKYIQWRLEGVEISSPYHFDDQNASSGALSAINNNLLATSDFYTGAFSPEYGDVLSGIYDVKFRAGNNEKLEASVGVGLIGTDITLEGPFKKGYSGSYLVNYRYNIISLIQNLGLVDVEGNLNFQDAAFNIKLPTKKFGTFSFFGMGGKNDFIMSDVTPQMWSTPTNKIVNEDVNEEFEKGAYLANIGMNHTFTINSNSFIKTTLAYSGNAISDDINEKKNIKINNETGEFLYDSIVDSKLTFKSRLNRATYRAAVTYSNKINVRNKIEIGSKYTLFDYDYKQSMFQNETNSMFKVMDFNEKVGLLRNFISWRYRINEKITMVSGFHNMNVLLNHKSTIEPRIAFNWKLNNSSSINAGYGNHSNMESIPNYFAKVEQTDGSIIEPNKNLDLLKAHHFVIGYEKRFTENLRAKIEAYYQDLYNLPVENMDTSYYATINEGIDYKYVALVNKGTGKNYGVELTLERFLNNNYYYLFTGSLYNSTYKSLEGIERNTRYNNNYIVNILMGKEFVKLGKKENKTLGLNAKLTMRGG